MVQRRDKQDNPWEWIIAILVGAVVTLLCVMQQVQPLTIVIRVCIAVTCAAIVGKLATLSIRQLDEVSTK
ncbi:MAG: hypothetical protein KDB27_22640 [Planctomycetales bacterium]|nr:hypothetical protein [Planctomycetales bacterium]